MSDPYQNTISTGGGESPRCTMRNSKAIGYMTNLTRLPAPLPPDNPSILEIGCGPANVTNSLKNPFQIRPFAQLTYPQR